MGTDGDFVVVVVPEGVIADTDPQSPAKPPLTTNPPPQSQPPPKTKAPFFIRGFFAFTLLFVSASLSWAVTWNEFVAFYKAISDGATLTLDNNITAVAGDSRFGAIEIHNKTFTIDGNNKIIDSQEISNLGFDFHFEKPTFKNITFQNFVSEYDAVIIITEVDLFTFTGIINFINNKQTSNYGIGGAIRLSWSALTFELSKTLFMSNSVVYSGGAIYLAYNSSVTFKNSSITFTNNTVAGISNDIFIQDSSVIFEDTVYLLNGVRISGAGQVRKIGNGEVVFSGENTFISQPFSLEVGSAVFLAAKSTVPALNMSAGTGLSLSENSGVARNDGKLFINDNFTLNGYLKIDFDFNSKVSDYISVKNILTINSSALTVKLLNDPTIYGSSIAFIGGTSITGATNLTLANTNKFYVLEVYANKIWLVFYGTPWNVFVDKYQEGENSSLLTQSIGADSTSLAFGSPNAGKNNFTIDGQNYLASANKISNMGFILNAQTISFKNISFTSFTNTASGAVLNLTNRSKIIFSGTINFTSNTANSGGVMSVASSTVAFNNVVVNFRSNVGTNFGGAFSTNRASITFDNSLVNFIGNKALADNSGAIDFVTYSKLSFTNSTVTFLNNSAAKNGGALLFYGYSVLYLKNSSITFSNNVMGANIKNDVYSNDAKHDDDFRGQCGVYKWN
jgi:predicted outer membrane repeat protein